MRFGPRAATHLVSLAAMAVLALGVSHTRAATIPISSTGNGSVTDGAVDPNWSYTLVNNTGNGPSSGTASALVLANGSTDFYSGWIANSTSGAWIGDNTSGAPSGFSSGSGGGSYSFSESFSMAGLDPTTASLSGSWTVDDAGTLSLNGHTLASLGGSNWGSLSSFSAPAADFVGGNNTLVVTIISSDNNWEGTLVQISSATANPLIGVPEPAAALVLGAGLLGLAAVRTRHRR